MELYNIADSDLLYAGLGGCLLIWCSLVAYSASRSDKLRQKHSMDSLRGSLEDSLRDLHMRRTAGQPTAG
ncbi:hypothetical protein [Belnapia rosea]|uniref:hypothetical protein n=1 Tax=Belnapia rosea TaxID=938405 RepID=UPI00087FFF68|nr:hypothetical protein [Belnapia rosea]SDB74556.1 hypothetical protein SAMN02927895_05271 [Belnapia rosea]